MLDLEKAYDEISQLKRASDSKSGKIQGKLVMLKDDFSNKNKIQTAVTNFMEHQAKSNEAYQNDQMHILNLDPPTSNHKKGINKLSATY